jgi:DNA-binding MarR family transcriptional regulator
VDIDSERELPGGMPDENAALWFLVRRLAGSLDRAGDALFRRELGVSLAQFLVLSVIDAHPGPLSQQAVADRLGLTKGTVSRQIDAGVAAGLITVQVAAHTRRENALALTPAGTAMVRDGDAYMERANASLREAIAPAELTRTVDVLARLLRALEE